MKRYSKKLIQDAKAEVLYRMGDEPWLMSVGVGLVADAPGIVISVDPNGEQKARTILSEMKVELPTRIQVLGPIRKRHRI